MGEVRSTLYDPKGSRNLPQSHFVWASIRRTPVKVPLGNLQIATIGPPSISSMLLRYRDIEWKCSGIVSNKKPQNFDTICHSMPKKKGKNKSQTRRDSSYQTCCKKKNSIDDFWEFRRPFSHSVLSLVRNS